MAALDSPQSYFNLSGGLPIQVDGDIVLCGRSDLAADRFFDGLITQFTIFDNALTSAAVRDWPLPRSSAGTAGSGVPIASWLSFHEKAVLS